MRFLFFFILLFLKGWAAPIGNPAAPSLLEEGLFLSDLSWANPQLGFTEEITFQKRLTSKKGAVSHAKISSVSELIQIVVNIQERWNFELDLGASHIEPRWSQNGAPLSLSSHLGCAGSLGGKGVLFQIKETFFSLFAQAGGWVAGEGTSLLYWQAGGGVSQKIGWFIPYLGGVINQTTYRSGALPTGKVKLSSKQIGGLFGGFTLTTGSLWMLNIEGRALFETGLSLSLQIRF